MKILLILIAILLLLFGLRLTLTGVQAALTGKVLVRQGIRSRWQPAPSRNDAWKAAIRDGLMGVLLMVLGVVLILP